MILIPLNLQTFQICLEIARNYVVEMVHTYLIQPLLINPGFVSTTQLTAVQVTSLENHDRLKLPKKTILNVFAIIELWLAIFFGKN